MFCYGAHGGNLRGGAARSLCTDETVPHTDVARRSPFPVPRPPSCSPTTARSFALDSGRCAPLRKTPKWSVRPAAAVRRGHDIAPRCRVLIKDFFRLTLDGVAATKEWIVAGALPLLDRPYVELAYAYALVGNVKEARLMRGQHERDVPAERRRQQEGASGWRVVRLRWRRGA